jgi:hypothetical protein
MTNDLADKVLARLRMGGHDVPTRRFQGSQFEAWRSNEGWKSPDTREMSQYRINEPSGRGRSNDKYRSCRSEGQRSAS